jgi:hypothetical protein
MSLGKGIDGIKSIVAKSKELEQRVAKAKQRALMVAGMHVLGVSNKQAPIETGELIRTGKVSQDETKTAISYDTDYAVVQHEDMSMKHDAGRNAKFLELAINSEREAVLQIVASTMKQEAGLS